MVSNESAVVDNATFLCRSLYLPYAVPHCSSPCQNLHGFARFPSDSTALVSIIMERTILLRCTYKKLSYCWETVRRESMPRIAEMDVEMTT